MFDNKQKNVDIIRDTVRVDTIRKRERGIIKALNENADPNSKNDVGYTSLHVACEYNNIEMIKLLLQKEADPNAETNDHMFPLTYLLLNYDPDDESVDSDEALDAIKLLLDGGAKPNITLLLDAGATPNITNNIDGITPLEYAIQNNYTDLKELLQKYPNK